MNGSFYALKQHKDRKKSLFQRFQQPVRQALIERMALKI